MLLRRFAVERLNIFPPRILIGTGLVLIALSLIWPRVTFLHGTMSTSGIDFIEGFLVGIGIAFEIMGVGGMVGGREKGDSSPVPRD